MTLTNLTTKPPSNKMYVVVARHGERWDYIQRDAGTNWIPTAERPWDPPLSPQGLQQATRLGKHLAQTLQEEHGLPPITACYSSPFLRCRQTACQAVEALNQYYSDDKNNQLKVRIEMGLSESLNESWYRSWALPGADATWGFVPPEDKEPGKKRRTLHEFQEEELHPASQQPAQNLLSWKDVTHEATPSLDSLQDKNYESSTQITTPYALKPKVWVETKKEQQERMLQVLANKAMAGQTILVLSHGGPVTHLYEKVTGNRWTVHGESTYCCYSIYECDVFHHSQPATNMSWKPIVVNQSKYLENLWSDATSNI